MSMDHDAHQYLIDAAGKTAAYIEPEGEPLPGWAAAFWLALSAVLGIAIVVALWKF
jgi:hypothetical protein